MNPLHSVTLLPPNQIIDSIYNSIEEIESAASDLDSLSFPSHEEIDYEINQVVKNINKIHNQFQTAKSSMTQDVVSILEEDLEQKTNMYLTLVQNHLIDDLFPFEDWILIFENKKIAFPIYLFKLFISFFEEEKDSSLLKIIEDNIHSCYSLLLDRNTTYTKKNQNQIGFNYIQDYCSFMEKNQIPLTKHIQSLKPNKILFWYLTFLISKQENIQEKNEKIIDILVQLHPDNLINFFQHLFKTELFFTYKNNSTIHSFKEDYFKNFIHFLCDNNIIQIKDYKNLFLINLQNKLNQFYYLEKKQFPEQIENIKIFIDYLDYQKNLKHQQSMIKKNKI